LSTLAFLDDFVCADTGDTTELQLPMLVSSWGFLAGNGAFKLVNVEHRSELNLGKYVSEFVHHAALTVTCQ
jgi:hypothetical protein